MNQGPMQYRGNITFTAYCYTRGVFLPLSAILREYRIYRPEQYCGNIIFTAICNTAGTWFLPPSAILREYHFYRLMQHALIGCNISHRRACQRHMRVSRMPLKRAFLIFSSAWFRGNCRCLTVFCFVIWGKIRWAVKERGRKRMWIVKEGLVNDWSMKEDEDSKRGVSEWLEYEGGRR